MPEFPKETEWTGEAEMVGFEIPTKQKPWKREPLAQLTVAEEANFPMRGVANPGVLLLQVYHLK
jgi:hypothetical protein